MIAVPEDTPLRAIPQNLFSSGKVTPLGGSVTNGRMLNISDAVWMIGSSCSSAPDDYRRGLVTINMDFVTDRKFELVRNGNTGVSAFLFQVRVPLQELISLPGKDLDDYLSILLADNPPGAKGSGSVRLGDSQQRVKEMLGPPENVFDLGSKVIYSYRSIKITFIDGKVSDVQ